LVKLYPELTLPEYLNSETLFGSRFRGNNITSLFTGVAGPVATLRLFLSVALSSFIFVISFSLGNLEDVGVVGAVGDNTGVLEVLCSLNAALPSVTFAVVLSFGNLEDVAVVGVVDDKTGVLEVLLPSVVFAVSLSFGNLEDVTAFGAVDGKPGVLEMLCPGDDTVVKVVDTG